MGTNLQSFNGWTVGQTVIYRPPHVSSKEPGEEGVITSLNQSFAFVRYGAEKQSKATLYAALHPAFPSIKKEK